MNAVIEKISNDMDNIDIEWNIDISILRMLISIYHIKNGDAVKEQFFVLAKFTQIHS